jgi:hypothetical protein
VKIIQRAGDILSSDILRLRLKGCEDEIYPAVLIQVQSPDGLTAHLDFPGRGKYKVVAGLSFVLLDSWGIWGGSQPVE